MSLIPEQGRRTVAPIAKEFHRSWGPTPIRGEKGGRIRLCENSRQGYACLGVGRHAGAHRFTHSTTGNAP
jgi:hypothetical protein